MTINLNIKTLRLIQIIAGIVFIASSAYVGIYIWLFKLPSVSVNNLVDHHLQNNIIDSLDIDSHDNVRDLFRLMPEEITGDLSDLSSFEQLPSHLKVVGIMVANPATVVIEDTKQQKTFFVQEGKPVFGIALEKINDSHIYLKIQGNIIQIQRNQR